MKMNSKILALVFVGVFIVSAGLSMGVSLNSQDALGLTAVDDPEDTEDPEVEDEDTEDSEGTEEDEDEDDDEVDDDYEEEHGREVKVEYDEDEIKIESELKNGNSKDQFTVKIEAGDNLGIKLEYESESESTTGEETELEIEFKVVFKAIIEFVDTNGDGLYNKSDDEEIQEYPLDDFDSINYLPITQPDNSTLHYFNVSTTNGSVFTAHLFVAGEFMDVEATTLTPTQVKIDIEILNFPYLNDSSQLALYTKLESEYEIEEEENTEDEELGFATEEAGIQADMNGFLAGFTWAEFADVDGQSMPVYVTSPMDVESDDDEDDEEDDDDEKIYIVYPRGAHIYHDPKIGVLGIMADPSPSFIESIPGFPLWGLAAGAIAIVGMLIISKRKFK